MNVVRWMLGCCLAMGAVTAVFAQGAPTLPPAGATKYCLVYVPNTWRTVTPVPGTWSLDDCRNLGQAVGATTLQVACVFEKTPAGQATKFITGGDSPIASPPINANLPNPNCGW
jgi:hypothetical protein